ncbi:hypothetical protein DKT77_07375 [Meridianimarinicoccus roseus]|uniref:Uncharacterized protein n=1 Tax=Meridianimarinicoccus roseus TaxID=2072018 RepID=A0A2V2LLT2_9RHOB|nr:hypothetical protein [Meridianimarinicoccus roseus]PWR03279.1 hypothetical protein DKT77_07375 [Meridianimarinicoccus roseus]
MSQLLDLGGPGLGRRLDALNAGWRGAVVRALNLNGDDFQLLTGALDAGLTRTERGLAQLADRVPPATEVAALAPPGRSTPRFSQGYRRLLDALLPETESGLRGFLGDDYPSWVSFRNAARTGPPQRLLFGLWVRAQLAADRRRRATMLFDEAAQDAVSLARDAFGQVRFRRTEVSPRGAVRHVPGYGIGPDVLQRAMFPLQGTCISYDSEAPCSAGAGALRVGGGTPGRAGLLGRDASETDTSDILDQRVAAARITVVGRIGARGVVTVQPEGWYDPATVQRAFRAGPCREVWDDWSATGRWCSFFGRGGLLSRHVSHLVFVAGADLTLSCHGCFDAAEQAALCARIGLRPDMPTALGAGEARSAGIWPFTLPRGFADMIGRLHFDAAGTLHLSLRQTPGSLQCWGARVGTLAESS